MWGCCVIARTLLTQPWWATNRTYKFQKHKLVQNTPYITYNSTSALNPRTPKPLNPELWTSKLLGFKLNSAIQQSILAPAKEAFLIEVPDLIDQPSPLHLHLRRYCCHSHFHHHPRPWQMAIWVCAFAQLCLSCAPLQLHCLMAGPPIHNSTAACPLSKSLLYSNNFED